MKCSLTRSQLGEVKSRLACYSPSLFLLFLVSLLDLVSSPSSGSSSPPSLLCDTRKRLTLPRRGDAVLLVSAIPGMKRSLTRRELGEVKSRLACYSPSLFLLFLAPPWIWSPPLALGLPLLLLLSKLLCVTHKRLTLPRRGDVPNIIFAQLYLAPGTLPQLLVCSFPSLIYLSLQ